MENVSRNLSFHPERCVPLYCKAYYIQVWSLPGLQMLPWGSHGKNGGYHGGIGYICVRPVTTSMDLLISTMPAISLGESYLTYYVVRYVVRCVVRYVVRYITS